MNPFRAFLPTVLAAATTAAWAQYDDPALQKRIEAFSAPAGPASRTLTSLSSVADVKLLVSPQIAAESLYVNVTDVPLPDLMKRIAAVCSGEWRAEEGGYRLIRPVAIANQEANAERLERLAKIRKAIQQRLDAFKPKPANQAAKPGEAEEGSSVGFFAPGMGGSGTEKGIAKLLALCDANPIATMESGDRVVFSSSPTRMQRPFHGDVAPIVQEMVATHNREVAGQNQDADVEDAEALREFLKMLGLDQDRRTVDSRPAKVLLAVSRGGGGMMAMMGGLGVQLSLFDTQGKIILSGQSALMDEDSMFGVMAGAVAATVEAATVEGAPKQKAPSEPKVEGPDGPIAFSKETKELAGLFGNSEMPTMPTKMSPELEAKMVRPDLHDPLAFSESECLDSAAKVKGLDIVANLPDSRVGAFGGMMQAGGGGTATTVQPYVVGLLKDRNVKSELGGGWLVVRPSHPVVARAERVDRVSLAALVASAKAHGLPRLDDYAAYSLKNAPPFETPASMLYLMLFAPNAMSAGMMGMTDWAVMRLYGSLTPVQRQSIRNGTEVSFGQIEPGQRRWVEKIVFGSNHGLTVGPPPTEDQPIFMQFFRGMMGSQAQDWRQEPTEVMPNGLPNQGVLRIKLDTSTIGQVDGADNQMASMFGALGPAELAFFQLMKEEPQFAAAGGMMPEIPGLRLGRRSTYRFTFHVAPEVSTVRSLNDDVVDKNAPVVRMDNLPADFREEIDRQAKALKNSPIWKMMTGGIGQRQTIPPYR